MESNRIKARSTCHLLLSVHFASHQRTCLHWRKSRWFCLEAKEGASHLEILISAWVILRCQHCSLSVNESTNLRKIKTKVRTRSQREMQAILYQFIDCKIHLPSFLFQCRFSPFFWQFGTFRLHLIGFCGFGGGNSKTPTALSTCPPYFMAFKPKSKMPSGIFSVKKAKAGVDDTFTALQAF